MNRSSLYILLAFALFSTKVLSQSIFQKANAPLLSRVEQEVNSADEIIIAGNSTFNNHLALSTFKYNKCGTVLWSKQFSADTIDIRLIDLKMDQNQNAILAGNYIYSNGDQNAFLMSLSSNGTLNYFKVFDTKTDDIVYSLDINSQNEILLYFKTNIGQAGPNSNNTLAKLDANGQVLWIKDYGFTWVWGQMCSSSDGGALISDIREIVKVNDSGNVSWTKALEKNYYSQDHFEIPGGFVFFRYNSSALNRSYATMVDYSGNVKWNSQTIQNFYPAKGILRANGNLLFVGDLQLQSITNNPTFIEIDSSDGTIIQTVIQKENSPLVYLQDLNELSDQSIFFSGTENLSFTGSTIIGRMNDTLSRVSCNDTNVVLNFPNETNGTQNTTPWVGQTIDIPIIEPQINENTTAISEAYTICEYVKPIHLDLGKDTILCPGNSIRLSTLVNFDGYLWSTKERTESIVVNQAGIYWLKAWIDCDTISDTIQINYHALPELELGNDTTLCRGEDVTFSTNNGETAYWSTGDTATNITIDQAGKYWADIPTVCGFISDTIEVMHYPELQAPDFEDTSICLNTSLWLNVDPNATYVLWSTGESTHQIQTNTAGIYHVTIANACDTLSDTLKVNFHPKPNFIPIVSKDTAKVLDSVYFQLLSPKNFQSLQWNFGDGQQTSQTNPIHQYKHSGWMHPEVTIIDSLGCQFDSSLRIYIQALDFHIPNVFTPNGDGINDYFDVYGDGIERMQIKVYNRWGDLIFDSENGAWDGRTQGGKAAQDGTYYYQIRLKQSGNAERIVEGSVSLIRESMDNMLK